MTTGDERAQAITAALDEYDRANITGTTHEFLLKQGMITVEAPDWLRDLLTEREKMVAVIEAARVLVQKPYFCGQVLTQALLDALNDPEYAAIVRDCLRDWDALKTKIEALER